MLQLIPEHIIRPCAIRPAAVWTASKNSTDRPPKNSTLPPRKSGRQIHVNAHGCFTSKHAVEQCGLCAAHLQGAWVRCSSSPRVSQKVPRHLICIHLLFTSLSWRCCYFSGSSAAGFGRRVPLWGRALSNLPRFKLSLFAGFTAPSVFSHGLFCIDGGADKRPVRCSSELWQKTGSAQ